MNFFLFFLFIYCVMATPITTNNNNHKIIGGFDAHAGQFPYQASIRFWDDLVALCGGSIISNQWILTSAYCVNIAEPHEMRIVVGSIYLNSGGTTHTVLFSVKHPNYHTNTYTNDIGVIRVNGQISYNDFVQPIQLSSDSISVGLPLIISGWGGLGNSVGIPSNTLQYITLKSIALDVCQTLIGTLIPLFDTQLCTHTNNNQGLCGYDDGSPLVYNGQQHAIVSMPFYCADSIPDLHTRVAPFRSWIKEITNV